MELKGKKVVVHGRHRPGRVNVPQDYLALDGAEVVHDLKKVWRRSKSACAQVDKRFGVATQPCGSAAEAGSHKRQVLDGAHAVLLLRRCRRTADLPEAVWSLKARTWKW